MKQSKKFIVFSLLWLLINVLTGITLFEKGYLVSWGLFGFLTLCLVISILFFMINLIVFMIKLAKKKSTYKINKKVFGSLLWTAILPILICLQVVVSEFFIYSPDNQAIAEINEVILNDTTQYYSVRTQDETNPVILFLAGGPGGTQIPATRVFLESLEAEYTIINWEQPGVGKSFDAYFPNSRLTPSIYVEDAHALTEYLKNKYHQEKIYIIGESWGTYIGILLAHTYPEDYFAYIGTGQMVDFTETEIYCYNLTLQMAREEGNTKLVKRLEDMGVPPIIGDHISLSVNAYLQPLYMLMERHEDIYHPDWDTFKILFSPEYSILNTFNYLRGLYSTYSHVYQQLYGIDLRQDYTSFQIPVYFIHGTYDVNAPGYLVDSYYETISAPDKEMIWFEHSGHNTWINQSDLFADEVHRLFQFHGGLS